MHFGLARVLPALVIPIFFAAAWAAEKPAASPSGKMVAFGPFSGAGDLRGMYIFQADNIEQAREWANQEPPGAIGMIEMKVYAWLGPVRMGVRTPEPR